MIGDLASPKHKFSKGNVNIRLRSQNMKSTSLIGDFFIESIDLEQYDHKKKKKTIKMK